MFEPVRIIEREIVFVDYQSNDVVLNMLYSEFQTLNSIYGLYGKKLYYINSNGEYQYAKILNAVPFGSGGATITRLELSQWFWAKPQVNTTVFVQIFQTTPSLYLSPNVLGSITTDEIKEDDIVLVLQVESGRKFDLKGSFGSLSLLKTPELENFFNQFLPMHEGQNVYFEVELFVEGIREFVGLSLADDIKEDLINYLYIIEVYDYLPFILKELGSNNSPSVTLAPSEILYVDYFIAHLRLNDWGLNIDVGNMSRILNRSEYQSYYLESDQSIRSVDEELSLSEFIYEIQKHYASYIYLDYKTKTLNFVKRTKKNKILIVDDIIIESSFTKDYYGMDYAGILLNTWAGNTSWEGWALATPKYENGQWTIEYKRVGEDIENSASNYLDLRQKIYPTFSYIIFEKRTAEQRIEDYKDLFFWNERYTCEILTTNVDLLDFVNYKNNEYQVIKIEKDFINRISKIEMVKVNVI